jgi:hypothetical protein
MAINYVVPYFRNPKDFYFFRQKNLRNFRIFFFPGVNSNIFSFLLLDFAKKLMSKFKTFLKKNLKKTLLWSLDIQGSFFKFLK